MIAGVLGICDEDPEEFIKEYKKRFLDEHDISLAEIKEKIEARTQARKNKDYETADRIRNELKEQKSCSRTRCKVSNVNTKNNATKTK